MSNEKLVVFRPRFIIGDTFYRTVGQCDASELQCGVCDGTKFINYRDQEWDCPRCHGLGTTSQYSVRVLEHRVNGLRVKLYEDDPQAYVELTYLDPDRDNREAIIDEDWCYATREEAQAEADKQMKDAAEQ